jgi:putative ABC transport system substrate-binding protein
MTNDRCTRRVFGQRFARAAVGTAIAPFAVFQTKPKQVPRVGFLIGSSFPTMVEAFRSELRQLGHVEGQSLVLEMRLSRPNTNDLASQVQELAAMDLDVVVAAALPVALAFRKLNSSTPMVIGTGPALVRNGLAESMDRPGKKTTGLDELPPGLSARRRACSHAPTPSWGEVCVEGRPTVMM